MKISEIEQNLVAWALSDKIKFNAVLNEGMLTSPEAQATLDFGKQLLQQQLSIKFPITQELLISSRSTEITDFLRALPKPSLDFISLITAFQDHQIKTELLEQSKYILHEVSSNNQSGGELLKSVITNLSKCNKTRDTTKSKQEVLTSFLQQLQSNCQFFSTGLPKLDTAMAGGMYPGHMYCFGARMKCGKSAMLGTISYNLNSLDVPHLFLALEMSSKEIELRHISRYFDIPTTVFRQMKRDKLHEYIEQYIKETKNNTRYEDFPGPTLGQLKSLVYQCLVRYPIKGIILDYTQKVRKNGTTTFDEHLGELGAWLADLAEQENIFIVTAAQTNQGNDRMPEGNTYGGEGIRRACYQYYEIEKDENKIYIKMKDSRYTSIKNIGNSFQPAFELVSNGVYFKELKNDEPPNQSGKSVEF